MFAHASERFDEHSAQWNELLARVIHIEKELALLDSRMNQGTTQQNALGVARTQRGSLDGARSDLKVQRQLSGNDASVKA